MRTTKVKRILALMLAAVMLLALAACSKNKGSKLTSIENNIDGLQKVKLEHVYTAKELGIDLDARYGPTMVSDGSTVWIYSYYDDSYSDDDGKYVDKSGTRLYSVDTENGDAKLVKEFENSYSHNEDASVSDSIGYGLFAPAKDGTIWYQKQVSHNDWSDPENPIWENHSYIIHADAEGNELTSIDADELFKDVEYYYINTMIPAEDGSLYLISDESIVSVDSSGAPGKKINIRNSDNEYIGSFTYAGGDKILATRQTYGETGGKNSIVELNMKSGDMREVAEFGDNFYNIMATPDGRILTRNSSGIFEFNASKSEYTEILNWMNSDFNPSRLGNVIAMADGTFIVSEHDLNWENETYYRLSKVSDSDVVEKYVINLGGIYLGDEIADAVIRFNKQNTEFRINFLDYSTYIASGDYNDAITKINNEIIAGNIPDILMMDGLKYNVYASKGLLADLGDYMELDKSFDRSQYIENILNASAFKGNIYSIFPSFYVMTLAAKQSVVGDVPETWTMDDMQRIANEHPGSEVFADMTKENVLNLMCSVTLPEYTDQEKGTCSFNSEEFIKLLEIIKTFPDSIEWDNEMTEEDMEAYQNRYRDGKVLFGLSHISDFNSIRNNRRQYGDDMSHIGFPGKAKSIIMPNYEVAISAKTPLKAACWDFVKYLLSEEFQSKINYGLPVSAKALDTVAQKAIKESEEQYNEEMKYYQPDVVGGANDYRPLEPLTQDDVDAVMDVIKSAGTIYRDSQDILDIISEEAASFFSGQKDARTVADVIQSRVQIYMQTNM
ncbi:MAG: extracellular solute-binding protein [Oscillospiraceae bacterium]|nr:extracellular solute-binding protein [Oscillospiraceae bacterium]